VNQAIVDGRLQAIEGLDQAQLKPITELNALLGGVRYSRLADHPAAVLLAVPLLCYLCCLY